MKNFIHVPDREFYAFQREEKGQTALEAMPPGTYFINYEYGMMSRTPVFKSFKPKQELLSFEGDELFDPFLKDVGMFFSRETEQVYKSMGINHQVAYILFGPPGTGKTCLSQLVLTEMANKHKAVSLIMTDNDLGPVIHVCHELRKTQDSPIVLMIDEIDNVIKADEEKFLKFTDGTNSIPGLAVIGCTNHLSKIPERIRNRKSRVKFCLEIASVSIGVLRQYLTAKVPNMEAATVAEFCFKANQKGLTIDQFKNAVLDYVLYKCPIDKAIETAAVTYQ
jgi:hypothetical protein